MQIPIAARQRSGSLPYKWIVALVVIFGLFMIIPIYLQNLRGLSAYQAGLLLLPQAFASMVAALVGGRLVDRFGVRAVVIPGLVILSVALWLFTGLSVNTPYGTVQIWLILRSFALGFCFQPLAVSSLAEMSPRRLPQATSVSTTVRFVMSSFAVAVMATLVQAQSAIHYSHLADLVTPSSPLGQLVPRLQSLLELRGASASAAYAAAIQVISGLVRRQATVIAMQDSFRLSFVLALIAIVAASFVRYRRTQTAIIEEKAPLPDTRYAEAAASREEATLMV